MKKKPLSVAFCVLCLILPILPLAAQDGDYVEIGEDADGNVLSLYLPSIEEREHYSGNYIVGWIRWDYGEIGAVEYAKNGRPVHHSMDFYAANIKSRQIQTISETYYDENDRQIYSDSGSFNPYRWEECVPGTIGETVWDVLMKAAGYR